MKIRLTKKRLAALHLAITVDDILHEKFRRMQQELMLREAKIYKAERVIQVLHHKEGDVYVQMQIESIEPTPEGTRVICR
jgi:hypothetical protein